MEETFQDILVNISSKMLVSKKVNSAEVKKRIQDSLELYNQLDFKVSSLLYTALDEADRFKQLLFFFLVLEIYTSKIFKKIDFEKYAERVKNIRDTIKESGEKPFLDKKENLDYSIFQKFYWCALLVWKKVDDIDIEHFKLIKKNRDNIAHDGIVDEATLPIDLAEKLCLKLLSSHC